MSVIRIVKTQEITEEIDTPVGIVNFLQKKNGIQNPFDKSRYSVLDLVGCLRKSFYKQSGISQEELLGDTTLEGMWATVRGDFLHQMTYAYKWREMDMEYQVPLKDGKVATLAGRLDMYDWKTKTIIDLKTTKFVRWNIKHGILPKPEHILQLQCYGTIFSKYIPVESLNIVYADMSDIVTFNVQKKDLTNWIQTRIQKIEDSKNYKTIPTGEVSSLCKHCKYQTKCSEDRNGFTGKPLSTPKSNESMRAMLPKV